MRVALLLLLAGCHAQRAVVASPTAAPEAAAPSAALPESTPPPGFLEMRVLAVAPTADGPAVLLGDGAGDLVLPIMVGGTEALSIAMRHAGRSRERPLTHDLVDALLRDLGGALVKVHVDELRGTTFIGSVHVRRGDRVVAIDARPSDAIALAIGAHVPIYVARPVLERAGVKRRSLDEKRPTGEPAKTPESI